MKKIIRWMKGDVWLDFIIYPFMVFVFVVMLYPFLNVLAIALNDSLDAVRGGIHIWPRQFSLMNFERLLDFDNLPRAALNSVLRTVIGTASSVFFISLAAYALSRKDFIYRKILMRLFTVSMYVAGGLIPSFLLIRSLGMMNTFHVYIIPGLISVWVMIIMRSFMDNLPISLQESAMIDGASDFTIYAKLIMPLCIPSIATAVLFQSVGHWNSWWDAYLYSSRSPELSVLQFELQKVLENTMQAQAQAQEMTGAEMVMMMLQVTPRSIQMAITVVVTLPIVLVYPFIQKYLIKGMLVGSVKG